MLKRLALLGLITLVLLTTVVPAIAAQRAVFAELFGATW